MASSSTKKWNPKYLAGCVQRTLKLLNRNSEAIDLLQYASAHMECIGKHDCRVHRQQLKDRIERLRRVRRIEPWEHWLLSAAHQILLPVPGTKHGAVTMLRSALDEYDQNLGLSWEKWREQHGVEEPAYL